MRNIRKTLYLLLDKPLNIVIALVIISLVICHYAWKDFVQYKNESVDKTLSYMQLTSRATAKIVEGYINNHIDQLIVFSGDDRLKGDTPTDLFTEMEQNKSMIHTFYNLNKSDIDAAFILNNDNGELNIFPKEFESISVIDSLIY